MEKGERVSVMHDVTMMHDDWSTPLVRAYADEAVWDD